MARLIHLLITVLLFCGSVFAQSDDYAYNKIYDKADRLYKGVSGLVRWIIATRDYTEDDVTVKKGTLIFFPSNGVSGTIADYTSDNNCEGYAWSCYDMVNYVNTVFFAEGVNAPANASHLLERFRKVTSVDISNLNTANTKDMSYMFNRNSTREIVGLEKLNTSSATNMEGMFHYMDNIKSLNLENFDTRNVTNMSYMLANCFALTSLNISSFNTDKVTNMAEMFANLQVETLDVSHFNTANVTNMSGMFSNMWTITSLDLSNFDTKNVTDMSYMFYNAHSMISLDISNFNTENVTSMKAMFSSCDQLTELDVSKFNTANVTDMSTMFSGCSSLNELDVSNFNTAKVTSMADMFNGCRRVEILDVSKFDTRNVTDMSQMFSSTGALDELDLSSFNTSNVTDMHGMFSNTGVDELNLESFDTQNVTNMSMMFNHASVQSLNISSFDTRNVTDMSSMFAYCNYLKTLDLSNFNTAKVSTMNAMFYRCSKLNSLNISHFDIGNVIDMYYMFGSCTSLKKLDLSSFVTTAETPMSANIYEYTTALDTLVLGEGWGKELLLPKKRMICDNTLPLVDTTKTDGVAHIYVTRPLAEITVNKTGSGTVTIPSPAYLWDTLTIKAVPDEGYIFGSYSSKDVTIEEDKFVVTKTSLAINVEFLKVYNITFKDDDGNVLDCSGIVVAGEMPSCEGPEKAKTPKYSYTFTGWSLEIVAAEADAEYTPLYSESINKYKVTFLDYDSVTVISEEVLEYGFVFDPPEEPIRTGSQAASYEFSGWSPQVNLFVSEDVSYYATYTETKNKYKVTFLDFDEKTVISEKELEYGSAITVPEDPSRAGTKEISYSFKGWSPAVAETISENVVYVATYEASKTKYKVTFLDFDEKTVISEKELEYGSAITVPEDPARAATKEFTYSFKEWSPAVAETVSENVVYVATYDASKKKYTVSFRDFDGKTVICEKELEYGSVIEVPEAPTRRGTKEFSYSFKGWSPAVAETVSGYVVYVATYEASKNKYKVTFLDYDEKTVISETELEYGSAIEVPEDPSRAATKEFSYSFKGWSPAVAETVSENVAYVATYEGSKNKYKVIFLDYDEKTVISEKELEYGSAIEVPEDPTREATKEFTYSFKEWTPAVAETIADEVVYVAVYDSTEIPEAIIASSNTLQKLNVWVAGRTLQVQNNSIGNRYVLMDMQGRILADGSVSGKNFSLNVPYAGTYILRVGSQIQRVIVR